MTRTTKNERKYGKKPTKEKPLDESIDTDMYKILVDGSGFTKAMTYEDCQKMISRYEAQAKKLNRHKPSLVLVKQ